MQFGATLSSAGVVVEVLNYVGSILRMREYAPPVLKERGRVRYGGRYEGRGRLKDPRRASRDEFSPAVSQKPLQSSMNLEAL